MCTVLPCYLHLDEVKKNEWFLGVKTNTHTIKEFNQWYGINKNKHLLSNKGIEEFFKLCIVMPLYCLLRIFCL